MKPKIVKFKNGKYGVRRRHFNTLWIEIEFLSRWGWWHCFVTPSIDPDYTFDSIQEAQSVINKSKLEEEKFNQWYYDKGKVVKLPEHLDGIRKHLP